MLRRGLILVVVSMVLGLGIASAQTQQAAPIWDAEATKAARTAVEQGLAAVERLDTQGWMALSTPNLVGFDIDLESKPVAMRSLDEAVAYVQEMGDAARKMQATVKFENVKNDCHATADMAYSILEYNFVTTTPDGTRMIQPSQTTVVLTKTGGAWKWAHWHTSLSAAPTTEASK